MAQAPVVLTTHAIDRFIQRHAPHMNTTQAELHLSEAVETAAHLREKTLLGHEQWVIAEPHCVLVIKKDGRKRVCVTVLAEPEPVRVIEDEAGLRLIPRRRHRR